MGACPASRFAFSIISMDWFAASRPAAERHSHAARRHRTWCSRAPGSPPSLNPVLAYLLRDLRTQIEFQEFNSRRCMQTAMPVDWRGPAYGETAPHASSGAGRRLSPRRLCCRSMGMAAGNQQDLGPAGLSPLRRLLGGWCRTMTDHLRYRRWSAESAAFSPALVAACLTIRCTCEGWRGPPFLDRKTGRWSAAAPFSPITSLHIGPASGTTSVVPLLPLTLIWPPSAQDMASRHCRLQSS